MSVQADPGGVASDTTRGDAFMKAVLNHPTEAVLLIGSHDRIEGISRAAERLFGYEAVDVRGRHVELLMRPCSRHDDVVDAATVSLDTPGNAVGVRKDGRRFPIEHSATSFDVDGRPHYAVFVRDVTDRVQLEAQLQQSQKMEALGQLTGGVAHDVNNLLTVISGWCEALQSESAGSLGSTGVAQEAVAQIAGAAAQAATLTSQLMGFSRKAAAVPAVVDLNGVVTNIDRMLQRVLGERVRLEECVAPVPARVRVDSGQMSQVLINLALNARDAMPNGGRLRVGTGSVVLDRAAASAYHLEAGHYVRLTVSDTGCGIPADVLPRVFEPFFTTKAQGQGTGLGLATVRGIVRQAGGSVVVDSDAGRGTTFTVLLPEVAAAPVSEAPTAIVGAAPPSAAASLENGTETVLVVEDDAEVRRIIVSMLESRGYRVLASADQRQALAASQSAPHIDMLVSDVMLPEASGFEVAERVRSTHPALGLLFVSGYSADAVGEPGIGGHAASFLQKPFSGRQLARRVRDVLDRRRSPGAHVGVTSVPAMPPRTVVANRGQAFPSVQA